MRVNVECSPAYAMAYCYLDTGESVIVESGGMTAMSDGLNVQAAALGGAVKGLVRKLAGGESFFMGRYTAATHNAWVAVAPKYPGDIACLTLDGDTTLLAESGSFLASSDTINMSVAAGNVTSVLMREGISLLKFGGHGSLLLCSYGGLQMFTLDAGQSMVVDTGHVVAYTDTLSVQVGPVSSLTSSVATGEGLAMRATGPGYLWMQTRAEQQFKSWLQPQRQQNDR